MQDVAARVRTWQQGGRRAVFGRVVRLQGFSTWSGDEIVALNDAGERSGDILGRYGADRFVAAAADVLGGPGELSHLLIDVQGERIAEAGLSCGGQADLLLQPAETVPPELWAALAGRSPVALLTRIEGPDAGPSGVAVGPDGAWNGGFGAGAGVAPSSELVAAAVGALGAGRTCITRIEDPAGAVLMEAWVPVVRMVVVGTGEMVGALDRQARLLGWETRDTEDPAELAGFFEWAGGSAALVVLSHNPRVDAPALQAGLAAGVAYVGAMGSRGTQSRRLDSLAASGVTDSSVARIHRPIGLDLGGRAAPEVAMSICAEILATRTGREGRPLAHRDAPI
ncbi:MAG: XdhC family protein [Acidimicrobiales bacterium]